MSLNVIFCVGGTTLWKLKYYYYRFSCLFVSARRRHLRYSVMANLQQHSDFSLPCHGCREKCACRRRVLLMDLGPSRPSGLAYFANGILRQVRVQCDGRGRGTRDGVVDSVAARTRCDAREGSHRRRRRRVARRQFDWRRPALAALMCGSGSASWFGVRSLN